MFKRKVQAMVVIVGLASGFAACANPGDEGQGADSADNAAAAHRSAGSAPKISVSDGASDVDPTVPVTVESSAGLKKVTMTNEEGYEVESKLSADDTSWTTDEVLGYNRTYTMRATDVDDRSTSVTFTTPRPAAQTAVALSPLSDSVVGVGQTIQFRFNSTVNDRQAAQDAITIETSNDTVGAFYWVNNQELRWRPKEYWEPGTKVNVKADIYGVDFGQGLYGSSDNEASFTIGDKVIAVVDDNTKTMTVTRNGQTLRTIPVSLGRAKYPTPNGTYIVGDQHAELMMDSSTFGLTGEGAYRTEVNYATQMSYSGIYVHGAPWSVWAQGNTNTSHGCINVTDDAAQWFYNNVGRGDIVEVKNTIGATLSGYDGLGDWNIPWEVWSAGNADDNASG